MGNIPTKTTDSDSQLLENKQSELSHKVWKLETSNPIVNLGSDGNIPSGIVKVIKNQMKKNQVYSSNYGQNGDERRLLIKIGEDIFYLDSFKMGTVPLVESSDSDMLEGFAGSYYLNRANHTGEDSVTDKTTPVDADILIISDSVASLAKKRLSWANLKATIKTYFDTLYGTIASVSAKIDKETLTDNAIVRADGTAGDVQNSGVIIDDSDNITAPRDLTINTTYLKLFFGALSTFPSLYSGVWLAQASPSASNYLLLGSTTQTFINAPSTNIQLRVGNTTFMSIGGTGVEITGTGNVTPTTSRFKIMAGTSTISQINLLHTATKKTTPLAGDLTFKTDDLFFTITTGNAEKCFVLDDGARLTSGRIPVATTNGRLIDSPAGASGSFTTTDGKTVTVTNGLITNIV